MGRVTAIPARDERFDSVVSALVLNFVAQPEQALAEMRRVTRTGGLVAACVWDYAEGMQLIRTFWDAATALDPDAVELDEGRRFPLCRPEPLRALFDSAGLVDVAVGRIEVPTVFVDFDDLWVRFWAARARRRATAPRCPRPVATPFANTCVQRCHPRRTAPSISKPAHGSPAVPSRSTDQPG